MGDVGALLGRALSDCEVLSTTEDLKKILADGRTSIQLLGHEAFNNANDSVRQLACVLLRRVLQREWENIDPALREQFWHKLSERIIQENVDFVRTALAYLIGTIGKLEFHSQGAQFLAFVDQLVMNEQQYPQLREVGFLILSCVLDEPIKDLGKETYQHIAIRLKEGLSDDGVNILRTCVQGFANLILQDDMDPKVCRDLEPSLISALRLSSEGMELELLGSVLTLYNDLVDSRRLQADVEGPGGLIDPQRIIPIIETLVQTISLNPDLPMGVRSQSFHFIQLAAEHFPKVFIKQPKVIQTIINLLIHVACEDDPTIQNDSLGFDGCPPDGGTGGDVHQVDDDDENSPFRIACQTIDSLAMNLLSSIFFPMMMATLEPLLAQQKDSGHDTSPDSVLRRRAGLVLIGIISEGCAEQLRPKLEPILRIIVSALRDPSPIIRASAGLTLGQMAEWLQPSILKYASESLQAALESLQSGLNRIEQASTGGSENPFMGGGMSRIKEEEVLEKLCYAIEIFGSSADPTIVKQSSAQMLGLSIRILRVSQRVKTQEAALSTIAATAEACGSEDFSPYIQQTLEIIEAALQLDRPQIQIGALRLASRLIASVHIPEGGDNSLGLRSLVRKVENLIYKSNNGGGESATSANSSEDEDDDPLREACYDFFNALVIVQGAGRAGGQLFDAMRLSTCLFASIFSNNAITPIKPKGLACLEEAEEGYTVRTGAVEEIVSAVNCLTSIFRAFADVRLQLAHDERKSQQATTGNFSLSAQDILILMQKALKGIEALHRHYFDGIRAAIPRLILSIVLAHNHLSRKQDVEIWYNVHNDLYYLPGDHSRVWSAGFPVAKQTMATETFKLWRYTLLSYVLMNLTMDHDARVVSETAGTLAEMIHIFGPMVLSKPRNDEEWPSSGSPILVPCDETIGTMFRTVELCFINEHVCQSGYDVDIKEAESSRSREEDLFEGLSLMLGAIFLSTEAAGPEVILDHLFSLVKHPNSMTLRCRAFGAFSDLIRSQVSQNTSSGQNAYIYRPLNGEASSEREEPRQLCSRIIEHLSSEFAANISQEDSIALRHDASYCASVCLDAMAAQPSLRHYLPQIIQAVQIALQQINKHGLKHVQPSSYAIVEAKDNLLGLLARILTHHFDLCSPELLSLFAVNLPLRKDFSEAPAVAKALCTIMEFGEQRERLEALKSRFVDLLCGAIKTISCSKNRECLSKEASSCPALGLDEEVVGMIFQFMRRVLSTEVDFIVASGTKLPHHLMQHPAIQTLFNELSNNLVASQFLLAMFE